MEEIDPRAFNNGAEDSGLSIAHTYVNDGSRHQCRQRRRNHRPPYARRPQKHYPSHFGWLRIRFRLWKRSSRPTLPTATLMSRYFLPFYYSLSLFEKPKKRKQTSFFFFSILENSRALREMEEIDPRAFNNGAEDSGLSIAHTYVNDGSNSKSFLDSHLN